MSRRHPDLRTAPTFAIADLPTCKGGMSRRQFCVLASSGLVGLGLGACDPGAARITVGDGVDGPPVSKGPTVDGGVDLAAPMHDAGAADLVAHDLAAHDLATTSACSGPFNAGAASAIAVGAAKYLTDNVNFELFLCRDGGGLYALSAACTHEGVKITKQTSRFYCPAHGATFDLNGEHPTSPALSPLDHYALCVDANGDILIDYNTVVSASTRA